MENEFSMQHSQDPAVRPYPEPDESISFPHTPVTSASITVLFHPLLHARLVF